jgi:hypothetical protein
MTVTVSASWQRSRLSGNLHDLPHAASANPNRPAAFLHFKTRIETYVALLVRSIRGANQPANVRKGSGQEPEPFLGCKIQKGMSSDGVFSVAGAVGTVSFRSSLRIENALICHAVSCALDLFLPLPTSFW